MRFHQSMIKVTLEVKNASRGLIKIIPLKFVPEVKIFFNLSILTATLFNFINDSVKIIEDGTPLVFSVKVQYECIHCVEVHSQTLESFPFISLSILYYAETALQLSNLIMHILPDVKFKCSIFEPSVN